MVIHELGHFLAGRLFKFKITQFSIFMGPVLFEREKNGIRYNIKAFPIGASVSFAGEESEIEGEKMIRNSTPMIPDSSTTSRVGSGRLSSRWDLFSIL